MSNQRALPSMFVRRSSLLAPGPNSQCRLHIPAALRIPERTPTALWPSKSHDLVRLKRVVPCLGIAGQRFPRITPAAMPEAKRICERHVDAEPGLAGSAFSIRGHNTPGDCSEIRAKARSARYRPRSPARGRHNVSITLLSSGSWGRPGFGPGRHHRQGRF